MKTVLFLFGTRPEAIKLAPLIKQFQADARYTTIVCMTGQHREMANQVLEFFRIIPDIDLALMEPNQSLFTLTSKLIAKLEDVLERTHPSLVFVQGDTTTVFAGALSCFYKKIKIAHVEAGLRSHDEYSPFPEEMNRVLTSKMAHFHFAPTALACQNLLNEGIQEHVYSVGNTVIDALFWGLQIIRDKENSFTDTSTAIDLSTRMVLFTCHRRESFGAPFESICKALIQLVTTNTDLSIVYPVHLNPNIRQVAHQLLDHPRIHLMEPLDYPTLLHLMDRSHLVITDSGGIQEEAPSLGKPVLVIRDVTERTEGIEAGTAFLVGTQTAAICEAAQRLLDDKEWYAQVANTTNPYGDGQTATQIKAIVDTHLYP